MKENEQQAMPIFLTSCRIVTLKNTAAAAIILALGLLSGTAAAAAGDFPDRLYSHSQARRVPIGIAPRSWVAIHGKYIYFTEKSRPPAKAVPGTVYRKLFRVSRSGKKTTRIASLGNVLAHPILLPGRDRLVYTRRLKDSSGNGRLDYDDNRIICALRFNGKGFRKLSSPAKDSIVLDATRDGKTLALLERNSGRDKEATLCTLRLTSALKKPGSGLRRLFRLPSVPEHVFFDCRDRLFIRYQDGKLFQVRGAKQVPAESSPCLVRRKNLRIFLSLKNNSSKYAKKDGSTLLGLLPVDTFRMLFPIDRKRDLILDTTFGNRKLFIGNIQNRKYQILYNFPRHTTRIAFSHDYRQAVFLGSFDTDKDRNLSPDTLDKSAIYYLRVGR